MADAIRERRVVRSRSQSAERPDGSRVAFRLYPTPLFDETGGLTGAVNMLIDALHEQAERCRRLARALYSRDSTIVLEGTADRFERTVKELRAASGT